MLKYLGQATNGHFSLQNKKRKIKRVLIDNKTSKTLKKNLREVEQIKIFAAEMGLASKGNYDSFTQLRKPYVVWVVSACKPYQFQPKIWSFPLVGSFNYLGWYNEESAKNFAKELSKEGWEIYVRGATAYSTLGWFRDPVFSSMLPKREVEIGLLVNVIIHELVHANIYIKNQSYFNESLAEFVANHLTEIYLQKRFSSTSKEFLWYKKIQKIQKKRNTILKKRYKQLEKIYTLEKNKKTIKKEKEKIFKKIKKELFFKIDLNNAFLLQYKTYNQDFSVFKKLLNKCENKMKQYLIAMHNVKRNHFIKEQQQDFSFLLEDKILNYCLLEKNTDVYKTNN